jgi:hypothetical protein
VAEEEERKPGEDAWFRRPALLGATVMGATVVLSIFFI